MRILCQRNRNSVRDENEIEYNSTASVQILARSLHQRLLVRPLQSGPILSYHSQLDSLKTVQVMVLCNVIHDLVLRHSDEAIQKDYGSPCIQDLAASLPRVLQFMAAPMSTVDLDELSVVSTMAYKATSNSIRTMRRLITAKNVSLPASSLPLFVDALALLLRSSNSAGHSKDSLPLPSDILVEAACALALVANLSKTTPTPPQHPNANISAILDENCRVLLSILVAAASTESWRGAAVQALLQLGSVPAFRITMAQRRVLVRIVIQSLNDTAASVRADAIELLGILAWNAPTADGSFQVVSTASLIVNAMARGALKESNVKLQLRMSTMIHDSLQMDGIDREQKYGVLETLFSLAVRSENEELCINAALFYLGGAKDVEYTVDVLKAIVHLATSSFAKVRSTSLRLLKHISFWESGAVRHLLDSTEMLDRLHLTVSLGSDLDCCLVTEICQQLIFDPDHHPAICGHHGIMDALVNVATTEPVTNREAYTTALGVVLELLRSNNCKYFVPFSDLLLPAMVKLANRTTNEEMKSRLATAIVDFSSAILENESYWQISSLTE
jgi:hypothetical protein